MASYSLRCLNLPFLGLLVFEAAVGCVPVHAGVLAGQTAPFDFQSPVTRELKGGEKHAYPLRLKADDFLRLTVEQKGIDVTVRLLGPDGKTIQEQDNPDTGNQGVERLSRIVEKSGDYGLEIESLTKAALTGTYELTVEAVETATERNRVQVEIEQIKAEIEKLNQAGKYDQALPLARQAAERSETTLGPEHPLTADCLHALAEVYWYKADYARAEPLFRRALALREKTLGPDHPDVAESLGDLALLQKSRGDFTGSEPLFQRSLAVREKSLGPNHPEVAVALYSLGLLHFDRGDYAKAEPLYRRALAVREKSLGPDHLLVAQLTHNLALLFQARGDYAQAEPLFLRGLAVQEKSLGPDHPDVATTLNNLGLFYWNKGDYAKAEPLYRRALAIYEKALGPDHRWVSFALNNLALLHQSKGEYEQAEPLFRRSLSIREKALGPNHRDVATSLTNFAKFLHTKGDYDQAEPLYRRALDIFEKSLGPEHRLVASNLNSLALLRHAKGDYAQAEPLYLRALAVHEKTQGPDHPNVAGTLNNLAALYRAKGDITRAVAYQTRANETSERDLTRNLVAGSERQKLLYLKQTANNTDRTVSLNVQAALENPAAGEAALTVLLRRKGRVLDALTSSIETLRGQQNPETQKLLDEYAGLAGQISVLTLRGPVNQKPEEHFALLRSLEERKEKLESEIGRRSGEFQARTVPITLEGVRRRVPEDAVLLEYAVYRPYDAKTDTYGIPRYVVYILDHRGGVVPADLGEAAPIDASVSKLRGVLSNPEASLNREVRPASRAVQRLVLDPVRALIGKAGHLLISPDGMLSLIPFAALTDDKGTFLTERFRLTYLTSGRDLLRLDVKVESRTPPLVIANPDYSVGKGPVLVGRQYAPLLRLGGTEGEGAAIKGLFPETNLKTRAEATSRVLKTAERPQILHIATHGRFLEDAPRFPTQADQRTLSPVEPNIDADKLKVENPLLRAWLFFAGANHGGAEEDPGTMTALETAQLDLWGTKLVVLSACETGLGETRNGDGVYGLRRALVLAGSETQMMSLWSVSDRATRELMTGYYGRLKAGEGRGDALRNVQLRMLKDPKRRHPFYWAAFIQSGEWANLDGQRR